MSGFCAAVPDRRRPDAARKASRKMSGKRVIFGGPEGCSFTRRPDILPSGSGFCMGFHARRILHEVQRFHELPPPEGFPVNCHGVSVRVELSWGSGACGPFMGFLSSAGNVDLPWGSVSGASVIRSRRACICHKDPPREEVRRASSCSRPGVRSGSGGVSNAGAPPRETAHGDSL